MAKFETITILTKKGPVEVKAYRKQRGLAVTREIGETVGHYILTHIRSGRRISYEFWPTLREAYAALDEATRDLDWDRPAEEIMNDKRYYDAAYWGLASLSPYRAPLLKKEDKG